MILAINRLRENWLPATPVVAQNALSAEQVNGIDALTALTTIAPAGTATAVIGVLTYREEEKEEEEGLGFRRRRREEEEK